MNSLRKTNLRLAVGILAAVLTTAVLLAQGGGARYLKLTLGDACTLSTGANTPEAAVTGSVCDLFLRTNGANGSTLYVKESGTATNTGWVAASGAQVERQWWPGAYCDDNVAHTAGWSTGIGTARAAEACDAGTNTIFGDLTFSDANTQQVQRPLLLPAGWIGAIDLELVWYSSATAGNVVWQVQTVCSALTETMDPAFNAAQLITDAAQGVAGRQNRATQTNLTTTGCAAGELLFLKILRDPAHGSDTLGATADLVGVEIIVRRAQL